MRAWNNVAGILTADASIDEVIAGGVVSATLIAPSIGTVSEHNRTGFHHWDQPHPIKFDWLNSLTAELQHFNGLLEGVIADVASAAQSALVAVQADAAGRLAGAVAEISAAQTEASQRASMINAQLASQTASAAAAADREKTRVQKAVDAALTQLYASEEAAKKELEQRLDALEGKDQADFDAALNKKSQVNGARTELVSIVNAMRAQLDVITQSAVSQQATIVDHATRNEDWWWDVFWDGTWEQAKAYPHDVLLTAKGYFIDGPWGVVEGAWQMVTHPIQTAQGLFYAVSHPFEAGAAIWSGIVDKWNSGLEGQGAIAFDIAAVLVPASKAAQGSKLGRASKVANGIDDLVDVARPCRSMLPWKICFTRDTLVSTKFGLRRIGDIQAGEQVVAYDFRAGDWRVKTVIERMDSTYDGPIVTIEAGATTIESTVYHPFWVVEGRDLEERSVPRSLEEGEDEGGALPGRWINSHELRAGDVIFTRDGERQIIRRTEQRYDGPKPVSNLSVDDDHTFAVGEDGILVHNSSWCQQLAAAGQSIPDGLADAAAKLGKKIHGHHIVMKGLWSRLPGIRGAVDEARRILKAAGIDDINDLRNLTYALNWDHGWEYARAVMKRLQEAERQWKLGRGELGELVEDALQEIRDVLLNGERYRYS